MICVVQEKVLGITYSTNFASNGEASRNCRLIIMQYSDERIISINTSSSCINL
jgi:hypothetical protein